MQFAVVNFVVFTSFLSKSRFWAVQHWHVYCTLLIKTCIPKEDQRDVKTIVRIQSGGIGTSNMPRCRNQFPCLIRSIACRRLSHRATRRRPGHSVPASFRFLLPPAGTSTRTIENNIGITVNRMFSANPTRINTDFSFSRKPHWQSVASC